MNLLIAASHRWRAGDVVFRSTRVIPGSVMDLAQQLRMV
jgi:hypothetical protein